MISFSAIEMDFNLKICLDVQVYDRNVRLKKGSPTFTLRPKYREQNFAMKLGPSMVVQAMSRLPQRDLITMLE